LIYPLQQAVIFSQENGSLLILSAFSGYSSKALTEKTLDKQKIISLNEEVEFDFL